MHTDKKNLHRLASASSRMLLTMALLLCGFVANAAIVRGTVTDEAGEPLIGATVLVAGSSSGAATDVDGNFQIDVPKGKTLRVSYVGYVTQDVKPTSDNIKIVMKEDNALLEEVVVVGYGTMKRKDLTGSITTVNSKDLNVGSYTDPGQLLQGKVPGLVVVQNSDPNGGVNSLTLRGASTLNGSTAPLYVVDGIPGVNLNLIPPSEIESIDVLRDASATAIYGSKAANGVIIVTTKRGQEGKARVTYQGYVSWERIANDHKMMTADQLRAYAEEQGINITNDRGADTNWAKEVQRTGFATNHDISISGGGKNTTYNVSLNYIKRDGIIKGVGNNLFTARAYVETKTLKDRLTIGIGVNGNIRNEWGVPRDLNGSSVYEGMYYYSPLVPVTNEDGSWYSDKTISQNYNPLSLIYENRSMATFKRFQTTGKASLKIIEGLFLNANFSYSTQNYHYKDYTSTKSQNNTRHGQSSRNVTDDYQKLMEIYANYDKEFGDKHKLAVMLGYSWEQNKNGDGFGARGYNYYDDSLGWYDIGMANSWDADPVWGNLQSETKMISFYGRVNYSFMGKYLVQAAVRRDGASTFGANHRWATFPSASVAWRLSEEDFLKDVNWLSDLKIRAGWGQSGNALGFDIYTSRFFYEPHKIDNATNKYSRFDYVDPVTGEVKSYKTLTAARNVNDDLKWETTTMLNLGIDFSFFNGRLAGTVEYYNKSTKDMIWDYPVSTAVYPVNVLTANVGKMQNRGVELMIQGYPVQTRDFTWNTSLNFSHNDNKVVSVSNTEFNAGVLNRYDPHLPGLSQGCNTQRIVEGKPIGSFYLWDWAGYNEDGISTFYRYDGQGNHILDANGNPETTMQPGEDDRIYAGSAQPKLTMGWDNRFTWKNWDLNIFFTGVFGQKIFNEPHAYFSYMGSISQGKNVMASVVDDQLATDGLAHYPSQRYLEDGSYFKLATVTLGYTFRNCFNGWLQDLRLYVSANNVFTITGYSGRDPEINLGGLDPGHDTRNDHYPRARQILVGASINF
ncbi:MAG: TonB-dependent receptor [Bacteroidales bacterium]|nr:TonB-dependent receptor [Bacteroidales bacterium]